MTFDSASTASSILRRHGLRPRRSLGQNFLEDPKALQQVVQAANASSSDVVLEIGPGIGSLTRYLAQAAGRVVGVEVDAALSAVCREELRGHPNVVIVHGDILNLTPLALGLPPGYLVAANIPYYITSPILRHLLESDPRPQRIVLTVQKEVAARICAVPPSMSLLAISVQVHGKTSMLAEIPAHAFHPAPRVDSAIIRIECFPRPKVHPTRLAGFFRTVKAGFLQPRKMLRNSMAAGLQVPGGEMEALLQRAGIDARRRAETLSLDEWMLLAETVTVTAS
jgi:16S rRNA (adenine1518-N6/adenine1519-N6)-dimethyltransferase